MPKRHRTVDRVAGILETVASHPEGVTFTDLVDALGAPKSSVHALMQGLLEVGYLAASEGVIVLGSGLEPLIAPLRTSGIRRVARPRMVELRDRTGETAVLSIRAGTSVLHIDQVVSAQPIRYAITVPDRRSLETSSAGKVFLAGMSDDALERYRRQRAGSDAAVDRALRSAFAEIPGIREGGVAYNRGEIVAGVYSIAAPIRRERGSVVAAVSIAGPEERMETRLGVLGDEVKRVAERIASAVGASRRPVAHAASA